MTAFDVDALESRQAIRQLPYRYAQAFAALDLDGLVALYLPDVALHDGAGGRAVLRAHFERAVRGDEPGAGLHTVILHVGAHTAEFDGPDAAHGIVQCHVEVHLRGGDSYVQDVVYGDEYARRDGQWYFARQRRHELVYGAAPGTRPNQLPPAHWPAHQTGRGTWPADAQARRALLTVAARYADAVDRRDVAALRELFEPGAEVALPAELAGGAPVVVTDVSQLIEPLRVFVRTEHVVTRQDVVIDGDTATGRTYAVAHHLYRRDGELRDYAVTLHYVDSFHLVHDLWRFRRRQLVFERADRGPG